MDHKTPDAVFGENRGVRRILPENFRKYVWTRREVHTVGRNGVKVGETFYYNPDMQLIIGRRVEIRLSIDDIGTGYIFDLTTGTYMYDADSQLKDSGIKEENVRTVNRLRRASRKHLEKYQKAIDEIKKDKKTRLEELREEESRQIRLKVSGGEDMAEGAPADIALVKPETKTRRKLTGIWGEEIRI
jgi:ribosomal protein S17E